MSEDTAALDFVLRLGRGLHRYGYPAHRLEEALAGVSRRLGLEGQFFSMPTALFASFGARADQRTFQLRVEPGAVELGTAGAPRRHRRRRGGRRLRPRTATARWTRSASAPAPYGALLTTAAFALTSAAAARFFGGGLREIAASAGDRPRHRRAGRAHRAALPGLGPRVRAAGRRAWPRFLAVIAAALDRPAVRATPRPWPASSSSIPGFTLTVAMIELATRNLVSGTARLAGAAGTFLAIGVRLRARDAPGRRAGRAAGRDRAARAPAWTEIVALVVAPIGLTVLLRASSRDTGWIGVVGGWPMPARGWDRSSSDRSWARSWARSGSAWPATPTGARCAGWRSSRSSPACC